MLERKKAQKYYLGQNLDVIDSVGKWTNAQVLFVNNQTIQVHYTGWSVKYDQIIDINSNRILTQWEPGKSIHLNNRIDAYHKIGGWLEAKVIEIGDLTDNIHPVKVHFVNYHIKYDSWVNILDKNQVAIIGSRSKANGMGKKRCKVAAMDAKLTQMIKKLLQQRSQDLSKNLSSKGLVINKSDEDGNCLFRSISDQLYGTQQYHQQIRKICMDYISYQKNFFQDFVVGDINTYIQKKRKNGQWGDDIQIQAISQIYSRPIQIYVFQDKPIRTFHQDNQNNDIIPIRLAYIGACHYDSIKKSDQRTLGLMDTQCGTFQQRFISIYKQDMINIIRNRNQFTLCNRVQDTITEKLMAQNRDQTKIQDQLAKALEMSQNQTILQQIQQIQKAQLSEFQKQYEQQKIQQDLRKIQQKQLQQAKKLSKTQNDAQLNTIQQKQLQQVKKLSKTQNQTQTKPYWFNDLLNLGYSDRQIWFAIQIKGYDPDAVQNFLLDDLQVDII